MPSHLDSAQSATVETETSVAMPAVTSRRWLKMGAITAASALAGGLAAAWFYRKTLTELRQAAESGDDSEIGNREAESGEEF